MAKNFSKTVLERRPCEQCGNAYQPRRRDQRFCNSICGTAAIKEKNKEAAKANKEATRAKREAKKANKEAAKAGRTPQALSWTTPAVCALVREAIHETPLVRKVQAFAVVMVGSGQGRRLALRVPVTAGEYGQAIPFDIPQGEVVVAGRWNGRVWELRPGGANYGR